MKIRLIYPPAPGFQYHLDVVSLPYGLGVLTTFLRKNAFSVDLEDLNARLRSSHSDFTLRKLLQEIGAFYQNQVIIGRYTGVADEENNILADKLLELASIEGSDIVGIRVTSAYQILAALLLAEKIKKEYRIPVVLGGPYVTTHAHLFFKKYDFVDYAIVGEGEIPLLKLLHYLDGKESLQHVPSLWYRSNSQIVFNGRSFYNIENQSCPDFDSLPLKLHESGKRILAIPYSTSRGCVHKCSFCTYFNVDGPWQTKSVEKVIKDITLLKEKYKSRSFVFEDTNFNISYEYIEKLCDELIKKKLDIQWVARVESNNMDKHLLIKMKKAGCYELRWGVESGSDKIRRSMKKMTNIDSQLGILKMAKEVGISNRIYLIINYPYETEYDLQQTGLLLKNNARIIDEVTIYKFALMYGSYLFNNPEANKIKIKECDHTFFSYVYDYEEIERKDSKEYKNRLLKLRQKIITYNFRYILSKKLPFPYNIMLKFSGLKLMRIAYYFACYLLRKSCFSEGIHKCFVTRKVVIKLEGIRSCLLRSGI